MILRCRLCHAAIAAFSPADLRLPMTGAMFGPLEPGFPSPFDPEASFDAARCPFCRHHPQGYDPAGRATLETGTGPWPVGGPVRRAAKAHSKKEGN
uniref:Uncharacterized protein n=1 Tax=Desulfovibrio sp. U5L TaxID=596152 RepID=I2PYM6_9BACT